MIYGGQIRYAQETKIWRIWRSGDADSRILDSSDVTEESIRRLTALTQVLLIKSKRRRPRYIRVWLGFSFKQ